MQQKRQAATFSFADKPHIMIVEARFYDECADMLLGGAKAVLESAGCSYDVVTVPGALEIPAAIAFAIKALSFDEMRRRYDGYVALGTVIKGGTRHDEIVGNFSAEGLQTLAIQHTLAIGNGILTVNDMDQALERADPARMNKGGGAAEACLRMIELKNSFRLTTKRRWVAK